jgi:hypothetical protein
VGGGQQLSRLVEMRLRRIPITRGGAEMRLAAMSTSHQCSVHLRARLIDESRRGAPGEVIEQSQRRGIAPMQIFGQQQDRMLRGELSHQLRDFANLAVLFCAARAILLDTLTADDKDTEQLADELLDQGRLADSSISRNPEHGAIAAYDVPPRREAVSIYRGFAAGSLMAAIIYDGLPV